MAALETDICLHDAGTVGAFHALWNSSTGTVLNINAAADVGSVKNLAMVLL